MSSRRETVTLPTFRRLCAAASAALVLALAVFAVSPNAHAWIHDEDGHAAAAPDDGCAVVLFASGVVLPLGHAPLPGPERALLPRLSAPPADLCLTTPRYLRQPERGPPTC